MTQPDPVMTEPLMNAPGRTSVPSPKIAGASMVAVG